VFSQSQRLSELNEEISNLKAIAKTEREKDEIDLKINGVSRMQ